MCSAFNRTVSAWPVPARRADLSPLSKSTYRLREGSTTINRICRPNQNTTELWDRLSDFTLSPQSDLRDRHRRTCHRSRELLGATDSYRASRVWTVGNPKAWPPHHSSGRSEGYGSIRSRVSFSASASTPLRDSTDGLISAILSASIEPLGRIACSSVGGQTADSADAGSSRSLVKDRGPLSMALSRASLASCESDRAELGAARIA